MKHWLLVTMLVTSAAPFAAQPSDTTAFLRTALGYGNSELRDLAQGKAAVKSLDTHDGREIAIAGAIRVRISPEQYIEQLRDIVAFKRHEAVQQIGTFGEVARPGDAAGLTLDRDHLSDLRGCRLQNCDIQLSRDAIERMHAITWNDEARAAEQANRVMREVLAGVVTSYRQGGDAALMTYESKRQPISVADEFRALVTSPPELLQRFPVLFRHVTQFPSEAATGAEDILYWSKENVGPKVIISVTHMAIHRVDTGAVVYAAASRQLYGSHYFDASLGLTLLLRDEQPGSTVLVYVNRSRIDVLSGFLGGLKRAVVRSRGRSAMSDTLVRIRARLPQRVGAQP